MRVVLDASAALYAAVSADGFDPLASHDLDAPALLWSEVTSVLSETRWRREVSGELAAIGLERFLAAPIARHANTALYEQAMDVAGRLGWAKTYDAEYVALAQALGSPLLTADARLRRGAERLVEVVGPDDMI